MAKRLLRFYPADVYLRDRPAPRAFRCECCGYMASTGTAPVCGVCAEGATVQRCEMLPQPEER